MQESWLNDLKTADPQVRRRAILSMANSREPDTLKLLKFLYEHDPDPENRELAKDTALNIWHTLRERSGAAMPSIRSPLLQTHPIQNPKDPPGSSEKSQQPQIAPQSSANTPIDHPPTLPENAEPPGQSNDLPFTMPRVPTFDSSDFAHKAADASAEKAQTYLNRALSMVVRKDMEGARKMLALALEQNPNLVDDPMAMNLASELTNLPAAEAVWALRPASAQGISTTDNVFENEKKWTGSMRSRVIFLLVAILALLAAVFFYLRTIENQNQPNHLPNDETPQAALSGQILSSGNAKPRTSLQFCMLSDLPTESLWHLM